MISILVGLSLSAAALQEPPAEPEAAPPEASEAQNGTEEPGEAEAAEPANGSAESAEDEEAIDEVCRRMTSYDMLGRPRSRKVCRPR